MAHLTPGLQARDLLDVESMSSTQGIGPGFIWGGVQFPHWPDWAPCAVCVGRCCVAASGSCLAGGVEVPPVDMGGPVSISARTAGKGPSARLTPLTKTITPIVTGVDPPMTRRLVGVSFFVGALVRGLSEKPGRGKVSKSRRRPNNGRVRSCCRQRPLRAAVGIWPTANPQISLMLESPDWPTATPALPQAPAPAVRRAPHRAVREPCP